MDDHFRNAKFEENIPIWLGLTSVWNVSFLGYAARAILPYCQALSKLAFLSVALYGTRLLYCTWSAPSLLSEVSTRNAVEPDFDWLSVRCAWNIYLP